MTDMLILSLAASGAYALGFEHGKMDCTPGNKFRSAYGAAGELGLSDHGDMACIRQVYVVGYLNALPANGVVTDAQGIVVPGTA